MSRSRPLAIVTGGGRRVGRAIALELAEAGFDLVLTCHRHRRQAERTLEGSGAAGRILQVDFNDPQAIEVMVESLRDVDRVDALIHNASSYGRSKWGRIEAEDVLSHFRVNALAPLLLTQALAAKLARSILPGRGVVVCLGDTQAMGRPYKDLTPYAMSKAALHQMVHSLAVEMAPKVRVAGIAPGVIAWPAGTAKSEIARYESRTPLQRSGTPEDAARCVRWLVTDAAYFTGETIRLDGGRWLR